MFPASALKSAVTLTKGMAITGERPPTEPSTAQDYAARSLPRFDCYGGDARAVAGLDKLRGLTSVAQQARATGQTAAAGQWDDHGSTHRRAGKGAPGE